MMASFTHLVKLNMVFEASRNMASTPPSPNPNSLGLSATAVRTPKFDEKLKNSVKINFQNLQPMRNDNFDIQQL